jgi:hypothetical protein
LRSKRNGKTVIGEPEAGVSVIGAVKPEPEPDHVSGRSLDL